MPPPVWFSQRGGQNAQPHCSVSSIGCEFRRESHSGLPLPSWNNAVLPYWQPSSDIDVDTRRRLRSADTAMLVVPSTKRSALGDHAFPVASVRACKQPAVMCQECTVADDVTSQTEGCTFSVVVRRWLAGRDCIAQYNCCLPAATDCRNFCIIWFNFVRCPCNVFDMTVSP